MTPGRYWCERAWLGGPQVASGVTIDVAGGRISAIATDVASPPDDAVSLPGLTMPAFANAHSHAFHRALRGRTHERPGSFWTWRDLMYDVAGRLDPDSYHRLARAVFAEMVQAGFGVVGEFHYVHHRPGGAPYDDPNAMGAAVVAAARDAGIRLTLLDTIYLHGGFGDDGDGYRELAVEQRRFGDGSATAWADRVSELAAAAADETTVVGAAIHSVRAVDPVAMKAVAGWAEAHDAPLHVHASEQPAEHGGCIDRFGMSPIELLDRNGAMSARTTVVHATHAGERDIEVLAANRATCCLCPTTERDLADGIGPSAALAAADVPICIGSDSHAVIDPLEEARAVDLDQRVVLLRRVVHQPAELATMATAAGYVSLGWPDGGRLAVGRLADFTTIGLDSVRLAGSGAPTLLASVLFAGSAADVRDVVVAGRRVVADGRHVSLDAGRELDAAIAAVVPS